MMRFLFSLPLFLLCSPMMAQDTRQSLLDADVAFEKATIERGLDGWMSCFADDAQVNVPAGVLAGKVALKKYYSQMFARPGFSIRWKPLQAEASKDNTLGYTFGVSEVSFTDASGAEQKRSGRYVTVWRRDREGAWKVVTDLGN